MSYIAGVGAGAHLACYSSHPSDKCAQAQRSRANGRNLQTTRGRNGTLRQEGAGAERRRARYAQALPQHSATTFLLIKLEGLCGRMTMNVERQSERTIKKTRNISAQGPRSHTVHVPELAFSHHPRVRFQIPLPVGVLEMQEERQPVLGNRVGVVVGVEVGLV